MRGRVTMALVALSMIVAACGSGPSANALSANRTPATTTTTEAPPEGIVFVRLTNGAFRPSNLDVNLEETPIVRWVHEDSADREYSLVARNGEFESGMMNQGDTFEFDFSTLEPGIYRYFAFLGLNRVPGTIDTRPDQ